MGRIQGVVLAGGLSRRMGRDKAEVKLRGRSLLARICDRLAPQCASLAISRNTAAPNPFELGYPTIGDGITGHAGPLAGVLAALDWSASHDPGITHVVTAAVDTPFLPRDFVLRLGVASDTSDAPIACAASGGRIHPVAALWPVAMGEALRHALVADGMRRVLAVLERFGFATVEWPAAPYDPFLNVNTLEDLLRAESVLAALDEDAGPERQ